MFCALHTDSGKDISFSKKLLNNPLHRHSFHVFRKTFFSTISNCSKHVNAVTDSYIQRLQMSSWFCSFFLCFSLLFAPALCLTKAPIVPDQISIWLKLKAGVALLFHLVGGAGLFYFCGPVPHARFIESLTGW